MRVKWYRQWRLQDLVGLGEVKLGDVFPVGLTKRAVRISSTLNFYLKLIPAHASFLKS